MEEIKPQSDDTFSDEGSKTIVPLNNEEIQIIQKSIAKQKKIT